jgi:hypothetical protein
VAKTLLIVVTFGLLIGLSPMSGHVSAMPTMQMDETMMSRHSSMAGENSTEEKSAMPCCDEIAQFSISCTFLVPEYTYVGTPGGSERVAYSSPLIQSIYIKILAPPPKS